MRLISWIFLTLFFTSAFASENCWKLEGATDTRLKMPHRFCVGDVELKYQEDLLVAKFVVDGEKKLMEVFVEDATNEGKVVLSSGEFRAESCGESQHWYIEGTLSYPRENIPTVVRVDFAKVIVLITDDYCHQSARAVEFTYLRE